MSSQLISVYKSTVKTQECASQNSASHEYNLRPSEMLKLLVNLNDFAIFAKVPTKHIADEKQVFLCKQNAVVTLEFGKSHFMENLIKYFKRIIWP